MKLIKDIIIWFLMLILILFIPYVMFYIFTILGIGYDL
jgi:hypothetical protein